MFKGVQTALIVEAWFSRAAAAATDTAVLLVMTDLQGLHARLAAVLGQLFHAQHISMRLFASAIMLFVLHCFYILPAGFTAMYMLLQASEVRSTLRRWSAVLALAADAAAAAAAAIATHGVVEAAINCPEMRVS